MIYRGKSIYLRTITPADLDVILNWENDPNNWKISSITKPYSRAVIQEFVNSDQDIFKHEQLRLLIVTNETHEVIGHIDLFEFDALHKRVGIGVLIDPPYRQKGFAKQGILLTEEYCKLVLNIKNMFCNILQDNQASIQLFTSLGYQKIGVKPNWHFYKNEWFDEGFYIKPL
ncbi:MAG: GNAT family N-acetyltransferase [Putridiphycobacter sp.]